MSVDSFKEIHTGRQSTEHLSSGGCVTTYTRVFRAVTTDASDEAEVIRADGRCPRIGLDRYPSNLYAYCDAVDPVQDESSKLIWYVTCRYTTKREYSLNPLADAAEIEWASEQFQRPAYKDKDGEAIVNSAGDPFDPQPMRDDSRWVATVRKNMPGVPAWLLSYQDAVNSSTFFVDGYSVAATLAKMQAIRLSKWQYRQSQPYRVLTMVIHLAKDNWDLEIQDVGFREKIDGKMYKIPNDGDGTSPTAPVPLDGSGEVLANPTPATVKYGTYEVYEEKDFNSLPLA